MKVGLYGGTFNPVHFGHLLLAEWVRDSLNLQQMIFIPAYIPPHKQHDALADSQLRLNMVTIAIQDHPQFQVSDYEIRKKDVSYSKETIRHF